MCRNSSASPAVPLYWAELYPSRGVPSGVWSSQDTRPPALHRIEQVCPGWGGDDILRSNGDPVRPLCPADILHIVVLHRRPQAGREGHRRGQLPQDRHLGAGDGKGRGGVHHHHESGAHTSQSGQQLRWPPAPPPGAVHPSPDRALQFRGLPAQLFCQHPVFLSPVHDPTSCPSVRSSLRSSRARRWREDTVPLGISRAAAVSSSVRPVKYRRTITERSSSAAPAPPPAGRGHPCAPPPVPAGRRSGTLCGGGAARPCTH